eukprot:TRINITY_DN18348_c0_g1_i1.p1 TRINITY_DN18348_c0_g1~~TRINITY_DN18348_c0_g1_i1.p1  ORF type:complete len:259 (+),score=28.94 TRINITY_DN18348_c0_g1_i1:93-869(+)
MMENSGRKAILSKRAIRVNRLNVNFDLAHEFSSLIPCDSILMQREIRPSTSNVRLKYQPLRKNRSISRNCYHGSKLSMIIKPAIKRTSTPCKLPNHRVHKENRLEERILGASSRLTLHKKKAAIQGTAESAFERKYKDVANQYARRVFQPISVKRLREKQVADPRLRALCEFDAASLLSQHKSFSSTASKDIMSWKHRQSRGNRWNQISKNTTCEGSRVDGKNDAENEKMELDCMLSIIRTGLKKRNGTLSRINQVFY